MDCRRLAMVTGLKVLAGAGCLVPNLAHSMMVARVRRPDSRTWPKDLPCAVGGCSLPGNVLGVGLPGGGVVCRPCIP